MTCLRFGDFCLLFWFEMCLRMSACGFVWIVTYFVRLRSVFGWLIGLGNCDFAVCLGGVVWHKCLLVVVYC